jgi:hypothetical protein
MATEKVRSFRYRPPRKRQKQLEVEGLVDRRGPRLPRAGDEEEVHNRNKLVRTFLMLAAVVGLALVMAYLTF